MKNFLHIREIIVLLILLFSTVYNTAHAGCIGSTNPTTVMIVEPIAASSELPGEQRSIVATNSDEIVFYIQLV